MNLQIGSSGDPLMKGLKKMCEDHKFTFLHHEIIQGILKENQHENPELEGCRIIKIPHLVYPGWYTISLRHACPYLKIFNRL